MERRNEECAKSWSDVACAYEEEKQKMKDRVRTRINICRVYSNKVSKIHGVCAQEVGDSEMLFSFRREKKDSSNC